jgi:hypothetical protein
MWQHNESKISFFSSKPIVAELGLYLEKWRLELGSILSRRTLLIQPHLQDLWSSVELPGGERHCAGDPLGVS